MITIKPNTTLLQLIDNEDFLTTWQELQLYLLETQTSNLEREIGKSYPISTVQDIRNLPSSSLNAFLDEVKPVLETMHAAVSNMRHLMGSDINVSDILTERSLLWIDDTNHHKHLELNT